MREPATGSTTLRHNECLGLHDTLQCQYRDLSLAPLESYPEKDAMTNTTIKTAPFQISDAVALLRRTPAALDALLRGLPDVWVRGAEGADTWTPYDIVAHLTYTDHESWLPRIRLILEHGEQVPFQPFDRGGHKARLRGQSFDQLLDEFSQARRQSLATLEELRLTPADFERRGRHPRLGSMMLGSLLAAWPVHDLNHLHQLSRVMARQYAEPVGPWATFMGVLQCDAHGA